MFELHEDVLRRLWRANEFSIPDTGIVFFGLRGLLPADPSDHRFGSSHRVVRTNVDHTHARCTLGQWVAGEGMALYPGSTVPHRRYVERSLAKQGQGANRLMTGLYVDYRKGRHRGDKPTGHDAFRHGSKMPVRRTADDLDYDEDDRVEYTQPFDNLHAGWCMGVDHPTFAGAGCQVVVGYPACEKRGRAPEAGPWAHFRSRAYETRQRKFRYVLLTGGDVQQGVAREDRPLSTKLRYGSEGPVTKTLQRALAKTPFHPGAADGRFGYLTLRAVLDFQQSRFGRDGADGVVGPLTAGALGLELPEVE